MADFRIRAARADDTGAIAACVGSVYRHYIERIGRPPGPMLDGYERVVSERQVRVAESDGAIVGVLVVEKLH